MYPINIDNLVSVNYYPTNETDILLTTPVSNIDQTKLPVSPKIGIPEGIHHNKGRIISQFQIGPEYPIREREKIDLEELTPHLYEETFLPESQQIEKFPKKNSNLNRHNFGRQENIFRTNGRYINPANVDDKLTNILIQLDESTIAPEKQVDEHFQLPFRKNPGMDAIGYPPINVKPVPLPYVGPDPQACPCYLVEQSNSTNIATSRTSIPIIGQFGFIPVIFVPYCPGFEMDSNKMKIMFPSATPVPYACDACNAQDDKLGLMVLDVNQLDNIDYLRNLLGQANLGFLNVPVQAGTERRKSKRGKKAE